MSEKTAYEHGARELKPLEGPDPHDAFSQKAAENRKPRGGIGLSDAPGERSENDKSDLRDASAVGPGPDAQGHSDKHHTGGSLMSNSPKDGQPGTTDQSPRWEGPPETRPRGYLPAKDDPSNDEDAAGETLKNPDRDDATDFAKTRKHP
jgi:hypothetical protein